MVYHPRLLNHGTALVEDRKIGNAAHVESGRELGMAVRVHLDDHGLAGHVRGRAGNLRRCHLTGRAPFRPEVDQYGNARVLHDVVELLRVNLERFVHRRQRSLARAAAAAIGQVVCRGAVLAPASFANSNHGYLEHLANSNCQLAEGVALIAMSDADAHPHPNTPRLWTTGPCLRPSTS